MKEGKQKKHYYSEKHDRRYTVEEIFSFYKSLMGSVASILPTVNMVTMREHHQQVELCTKVTHTEISGPCCTYIYNPLTLALKSPPQPVITMPRSSPREVGSCFANCKKKTPNLTRDGNEIELEFELIGNEMMWELERFVGYHKKAMSKMRRQGVTEDVVIVQLNKSPKKAPTLEPAMPKNKKVDVVEEDVDISEEIPDLDSGSSSGSDSDEKHSVQSFFVKATKEAPII
ncbi:hypothetical protein FXO37_18724 [Capsicum annuum]|nr:hypothetical protein FXO37_18724 [Capsicum annuum]